MAFEDKLTPALMQTCFTSASRSFPNRVLSRPHNGLILLAVLLGGLFLGDRPTAHAQSPPRPLQASDLSQVQTIQNVTVSPNGRYAAYTVRRVVEPSPGDRADTGAVHRTQLYVVRATGGDSPQLLTRASQNARQPAWHPDGARLAFVRSVDGTPQVFVLSLTGGEPYQLTYSPHGAEAPQWSPNGERLLFASELPQPVVRRQSGRPAPTERPGRTPEDLTRSFPPDTVLVLRHAQTLDPVDTLALGPDGRPHLRSDTSRSLRLPGRPDDPEPLATRPVDSLAALSADSLRAVFDSLRVLPDTTTVSVPPDTAASPDGDLVQVRRWMHQQSQEETARVFTRLDFQKERHLSSTPRYRHHYVVNVPSNLQTGDPPAPTPELVTQGYRSYGNAAWLPDGNQLVVSAPPPTRRHPDRVQKRNLYVVDLQRNRMRQLLEIDNYALSDPTPTADGITIAFRASPLSDTVHHQTEVGLFALDGRAEPRFITSEFDRAPSSLRWSPDSWYLYATAPSRGETPLFRFTPFSPDSTEASPGLASNRSTSRDTFAIDSTMIQPAPYEQMTGDGRSVLDFDVTDATAVYALTDSSSPSELYSNTISFNNEQQLTSLNTGWLAERRLSPPERLTVARDSLPLEAWVTRPISATDSSQHPMLVQVRGGPTPLDSLNSPQAWFERQYLAAQGFAVVEVWPRGSRGFGRAFERVSSQNWGPGPAQDVLAAADSAAALAWTDSSRQVLSGTSYGATLATWLVSQTNRFEAAVALNGVYDLPSFFDEGRAWRLVRQQFGGAPWDGASSPSTGPPVLSTGPLPSLDTAASARSALHRNSPLTYAPQIDTPLLLLQGEADRRIGPSQGERLYKRLKVLERPVEYVRYPGVGHDVARTATPRQRQDRLVRTYEFLARFIDLGGRPPDAASNDER